MMQFENGVHDISNEQYHSSAGISRSALWKFKRCPALYWHEYHNPKFEKAEPTANMHLGSLVHTMTLEPWKFEEEYALKPVLSKLPDALKKKDVGAEAYDKNKTERESVRVANELLMEEFSAASEGKTVVTQETYQQASKMVDAVWNDETAKSLIDGAQIEKSIFFTHLPTGLQCKVRPDAWLGSVITDLKTCADASFKPFQSEAMRYGYFLQAGMMSEALRSIDISMEKFVFMCVEKTEPYLTATYLLDDAALDYGVKMFDELMHRLKECCVSDKWPPYPMQTLAVPGWAKFDEI